MCQTQQRFSAVYWVWAISAGSVCTMWDAQSGAKQHSNTSKNVQRPSLEPINVSTHDEYACAMPEPSQKKFFPGTFQRKKFPKNFPQIFQKITKKIFFEWSLA